MNRLKEIREDRDYTQKAISSMLNMDQSNYSKYELEKINIPISIIKKLALFYEVSIDYLLYLTDERKPYPKSIISENNKEREIRHRHESKKKTYN